MLNQQLEFLAEVDKLKQIMRRTLLMDASRTENDAEHSWHLAMAALVLAEYAEEPGLDLLQVVRLVLVHDLVEIDAGDTFAYDDAAHADKEEREQLAADRIFGMLPEPQASQFRAYWDEFEAGETPEARFAGALDAFMPIYHNYRTKGRQWQKHGVTVERVRRRNLERIRRGSRRLGAFIEDLLADAVAKGYLAE